MVRVRVLRKYRAGRREFPVGTVLYVPLERARLLEYEGKAKRIAETAEMQPDEVKSFLERVRTC